MNGRGGYVVIGYSSTMDDQVVAVRVKVSGRVQGVFYRAETARIARCEGVVGWVRNCPDGTVEAELCGSKKAVDAVIAWCRHGPAMAHVDGIEVDSVDLESIPAGFEIRY